MSTADLLAGTVMRKAAALVNDPSRTQYTYAVQVPYLQTALQELQEYFALHNVSSTESQSAVIQVDSGNNEVLYAEVPPTGLGILPDDMIELQKVWESPRGEASWIPMKRVDYLPHYMEGPEVANFGVYVFQEQKLMFFPSLHDKDIKIDYLRSLFTEMVDEDSLINVVNARSFLEFRTAGLLAEFVQHDEPTAQKLNGYASLAMDRATGINVKSKQTIMTRRRPFRSRYKARG